MDTTNLRTGVSGKNLLTDFIDQIQVKSSGYAAEFGGSTGGVINVISKSGTNSFRGEVGTYFTSDSICSATMRPTQRLVLSGLNHDEYMTFPEDKYARWEPFGQIGGPLVRTSSGSTAATRRSSKPPTARSRSALVLSEVISMYTGGVRKKITNTNKKKYDHTSARRRSRRMLPLRAGGAPFKVDVAVDMT